MRKLATILTVAFFLATFVGGWGGLVAASPVQVGVVFSIGGLGDESFNDLAFKGLVEARRELGVVFTYVEPEDIAEMEDHQRAFAESGFDLVICVGFLQGTALEEVAPDYPDVKFAIIDLVVDLPNVASIIFKEHEGSFLVGAVAGMMTAENMVGFVGGMEVPVIKKFQSGFEQGVRYINPGAQILVNYAGSFGDPGKGKELALSQQARGADIIYHASGGTGMGVIEAAREQGFYAIGVDADQDHLAPGFVLTSMLKKVDVGVFETIKAVVEGTFVAGTQEFGIAEDGVGVSEFRYTRDKVPAEVFQMLDEIKEKIINGEIVVDPGI